MWALLYLGKATFTMWLLLSASLADFVLIKGITVTLVNFSAAGSDDPDRHRPSAVAKASSPSESRRCFFPCSRPVPVSP